jgi:hypothetical protein
MDDKNREKIFRLRLNEAEFAALIRLSISMNAASPSDLIRAYIHNNAPE